MKHIKKIQNKFTLSGTLLVCALMLIFTFSVIQSGDSQNAITTNASIEQFSNKKIGWGIKRNSNHEQPDVGTVNKNIIEKYNGICLGNKEKNIFI